jgi:hypothetical protein
VLSSRILNRLSLMLKSEGIQFLSFVLEILQSKSTCFTVTSRDSNDFLLIIIKSHDFTHMNSSEC